MSHVLGDLGSVPCPAPNSATPSYLEALVGWFPAPFIDLPSGGFGGMVPSLVHRPALFPVPSTLHYLILPIRFSWSLSSSREPSLTSPA